MGVIFISDEKWDFRKKRHFLHEGFFIFLVGNVIFEVFKSRAQKCHFRVKIWSPAFPEGCFFDLSMPFQGTWSKKSFFGFSGP